MNLLNEVKLRALAVVLALPKRELVLAHEALTPVTSQLDLGDVGYVYDPAEPDVLHTAPGRLHGKIGNMKLPPHFHLGKGIFKAMEVLLSLDEDYKKGLLVVTNRFDEADSYKFMEAISSNYSTGCQVKTVFVEVGNRCEQNLSGLQDDYFKFIHVDSIGDLNYV